MSATETDAPEDGVRLYEPDHSLLAKVGPDGLKQMLSSATLDEAQKAMDNASDDFVTDCLSEMLKLQQAFAVLQAHAAKERLSLLEQIIDASFKIKTEMGLASFSLIASVAKSLQLFAEKSLTGDMTAQTNKIIRWHVETLGQFIRNKTNDTHSKTSQELINELKQLEAKP